MRWIRFAYRGGVGQGRLREDGLVDLYDRQLFEGGEPTGEVVSPGPLLAPVMPPSIFAVGRNYEGHAAETGAAPPRWPVIFMKPISALEAHEGSIRLPASVQRGPEVDYEAELAVVIGRSCRDVAPEDALDYVLGYTVANDVSARRWQKHGGGGQWVRGKSFDTFCPLGPALVTADELGDPQDLELGTLLNGEEMQHSHTGKMIFPVAHLIAFLSRDTTLLPGTVILTGTPEGVGFARTPPVFLAPGDVVEVWVDRIGVLRSHVTGPEA
ncbi:MAG: fumarylacetoacetate hydrolase family protein [Deltaproteobacteria bacterium]|nr:fumarylacetoacetate hydrolase family protein [Deltaproteobacteria bacterium]